METTKTVMDFPISTKTKMDMTLSTMVVKTVTTSMKIPTPAPRIHGMTVRIPTATVWTMMIKMAMEKR